MKKVWKDLVVLCLQRGNQKSNGEKRGNRVNFLLRSLSSHFNFFSSEF